MTMDMKDLLAQLTLEEKAGLCSGQDFWHLKGVERLNIPSIMVTDGPHGLRKQAEVSDHIGLANSVPATCFPTASATASSWDVALIREMGEALGEECLQEDVAVLLGPGANIKRSPLCGRNFEYISEDPYLTSKLGAALVQGVQSKGIGTSLKHFVANNQEYRRMTTESVVDERALREIYLAGFEGIVKEAQPWTVMCAYNQLKGVYCSDNKWLLTDLLKEEWGHRGLVITDWGACNDRVEGIKAGLALEMPSSNGLNDAKIVEAVKKGQLKIETLDHRVEEVLTLIFKSAQHQQPGFRYDPQAHDRLARKVASHSIVLLKNQESILPLNQDTEVAILGSFAKEPRYQGAGSSLINPQKITSATDALDQLKIHYAYHEGYCTKTDSVDLKMIEEAVEVARKAKITLIFAGLTDAYESEGYDRQHLSMPTNQLALIKAVTKVTNQVVVVLSNGAPIEMPWVKEVKGIVECYLGGQAGGPAVVDVLYGLVNPSGKLAETFPIALEDDLASKWFGRHKLTSEYRESIYVGYRYYDSANKDVLFPFGHGLSYTSFDYSDLSLSFEEIMGDELLTVKVKVTNTGKRMGEEVVQLYVKDIESTIFRPKKELKGFDKISLGPAETKEVTFTLDDRAFAYYNVNIKDWHIESGIFEVQVGSSSRDIRLSKEVMVKDPQANVTIPDDRRSSPEYSQIGLFQDIGDDSFKNLLGRDIPAANRLEGEPFTLNSTLEDVGVTFVGKLLYKNILKNFRKMAGGKSGDEKTLRMMEAIVNDMPLRSLVLMSGGKVSNKTAELLLDWINGRYLKGLVRLISRR